MWVSRDALVVDATLNCLSILVRTRPGTSNRILNTLLSFDPLKLAQSTLTPKTKVMVKSMEKTTRLLLIHLCKRDPHNPLVPRIQQHVERMMRMMAEALDETSRKRALDAQADVSDAKRQRTDVSQIPIPPLGPGPHSLADIFSLTATAGLKTFDLSSLPAPLIAKMAVTTLSRIEPHLLTKSIAAVRDRLSSLATAATQEVDPNTAPLGVEEDEDDDYEPDFFQAEDTEQILNKLDGDGTSAAAVVRVEDALGLKSFSLPQPQPLNPGLALSAGNATVSKVMDLMKSSDEQSAKKTKTGFTRLAASSGLRDSWVTILSRLATRSSTCLEEVTIKDDDEPKWTQSLGSSIREVLYNYIMEDFRKRIDVAVSWLCEEWVNDRIQVKAGGDYVLHYEKCAIRLIDGFLPYLHPQDKILTRFLSEIPELNRALLSRVQVMCRDPSVVQLALTSLLYLVIMRPPVKEIVLDTVQDIWTTCKAKLPLVLCSKFYPGLIINNPFLDQDARPMAAKYLTKYRPQFLEEAKKEAADGDATTRTVPVVGT